MSHEFLQALQSPEHRLSQDGVVVANELFDRALIETEASRLIAERTIVSETDIHSETQSNAVTGLFEKLTASGHLSVVRFPGDQQEIHRATLQRLLNGYSKNLPDWEQGRRFQEICEEITVSLVFGRVQSGELPEDTILITDSQYPDAPVDDKDKSSNGYRTINAKGMLRSFHFEKDQEGEWSRVLEQLSRSNSDNTATREWFGFNTNQSPIHTTGALSLQGITNRKRLPDGVITIMDEYDTDDQLYGENMQQAIDNGRVSYANVRQRSEDNEKALSKYTDKLSKIDEGLKRKQKAGLISYSQRLSIFNEYIEQSLLPKILIQKPQYAKDTYGVKAAKFVHNAHSAMLMGEYNRAAMMLRHGHLSRDKEASVSCGGSGAGNDMFSGDLDIVIGDAIQDMKEKLEDRESWSWSNGVCQVDSCPTRPGETEVGPCSVCRDCQKMFDDGKDPTKMDKNERTTISAKRSKNAAGIASLIETAFRSAKKAQLL